MIKKTVTYTDFDGKSRTEELYFNLTKVELTKMAMDLPDDVKKSMGDDPKKIDERTAAMRMIEVLGGKGVFEFIETLVFKAYGVKSEDGRRMIKKDPVTGRDLAIEFTETLAYDQLITELMSDDAAAAAFVNGIIPAELVSSIAADNNVAPFPAQ